MWLEGLPDAILPLWQLAHVPETALWLNRAFCHEVVVWQSSQVLLVGIWFDDLPPAIVPLWQALHVVGVAANCPPRWQDWHGTVECWPVSGKLVAKWSKRTVASWAPTGKRR
jgi:hypothetical protein